VALPSTFASPSEIHSSSRGPFSRRLQPCRGVCSGDQIARAPPLLSRSGLLSWGCQISPLRRHRAKRPLPVVTWLRRAAISTGPFGGLISKTRCRPSAWSCQTPNSFRPCRSSRLRRFTPLDTSQVFCALHPTMGFATFQDSFAASLGCAREEHPYARSHRPLARTSAPVAAGPTPFDLQRDLLVWGQQRWLTRFGVHPRWRYTLRSFPLADSCATSPWSMPSRRSTQVQSSVKRASGEGRGRQFPFPEQSTSRPCSVVESVVPP